MRERHPDDLLTVPEAAKRLNISKRTMQRRIAAKEIAAVDVGGRLVRIDPRDILAFIAKSKT